MTTTSATTQEIERVADAIDLARYRHPDLPRERPRPFAEADASDREYAIRLARAALATREPEPLEPQAAEYVRENCGTPSVTALVYVSVAISLRRIADQLARSDEPVHDAANVIEQGMRR